MRILQGGTPGSGHTTIAQEREPDPLPCVPVCLCVIDVRALSECMHCLFSVPLLPSSQKGEKKREREIYLSVRPF